MDFKQLSALVTVAELGSVTKAARLLDVVQSAVTRQIRLLEDEIGLPLFERTAHGMVLTAVGETLVERSRRILTELELARSEIRPDPGEATGTVTVGVLDSVLDIVVVPLVSRIRERHPGVALRLVTGYSGHLQEWMEAGEVDLSLLYRLVGSSGAHSQPLLGDRLWAIAPAEAGLEPGRPVRWAEAFAHPLVLPSSGHGLRRLIDQAQREIGSEPTVVLETNSSQIQKRLVMAGLGWSVLPASNAAPDILGRHLSGGPLVEPETFREVMVGLPRRRQTPHAVEVVHRELSAVVRESAASGRWPTARLGDPDGAVV